MELSNAFVLFSDAYYWHLKTAEEETSSSTNKRCSEVVTYAMFVDAP